MHMLSSVLVKNLPVSITEESLSSYFLSHLDISSCRVTLVHTDTENSIGIQAIVNLGSFGKVQQAIRTLHGKEIDGKHISVLLDLSSIPSEQDKKKVVNSYLFEQYRDVILPRKRLNEVLTVLANSLNPEHMLEYCMDGPTFQLYADVVDDALANEKESIPQLSTPALEAAKAMGLAGKPMEEILQSIREELYRKGLSRFPWKWESFHVPTLPDAVSSLVLELGMDKLDNIQEWKQALSGHMNVKCGDRYVASDPSKAIDKMLSSATTPETFYNMLRVCTADKYRFSLYLVVAFIAVDRALPFSYREIPDSVVSLVRDLYFGTLSNVRAFEKAMADHLLGKYGDRYGKKRLYRIVREMFRSLLVPDHFYKLLEVFVADAYAFSVYVVEAERIKEDYDHFVYRTIPDSVMSVLRQFDINSLSTEDKFKQVMLDHMLNIHGDEYDAFQLTDMFDDIDACLSSCGEFYQLLEICCADVYRFSVYVVICQGLVDPCVHFQFERIPESVVSLVKRLALHELDTIAKWKRVLKRHLTKLHGHRYSKSEMKAILYVIFGPKTWSEDHDDYPEMLDGDPYQYPPSYWVGGFYDQLEVCTADPHQFSVHVVSALIAYRKGDYFPFGSISKSAVPVLHQMDLQNLVTLKGLAQEVRKYLLAAHGHRYATTQLTEVLDTILSSMVASSDVYRMIELCAVDAYEFSVHAVMTQIALRTKSTYSYLHSLPGAVKPLVRQLDITKLQSIEGFQQALLEHLLAIYGDRYTKELLESVLSRLFHSLTSCHEFGQLLEICAADVCHFSVFVMIAKVAIRQGRRFPYKSYGSTRHTASRDLDIGHLGTVENFRQSILTELLQTQGDGYTEDQWVTALNDVFKKLALKKRFRTASRQRKAG